MVLDKMKLLQSCFGALMAHLTDAMMAQYRCTWYASSSRAPWGAVCSLSSPTTLACMWMHTCIVPIAIFDQSMSSTSIQKQQYQQCLLFMCFSLINLIQTAKKSIKGEKICKLLKQLKSENLQTAKTAKPLHSWLMPWWLTQYGCTWCASPSLWQWGVSCYASSLVANNFTTTISSP